MANWRATLELYDVWEEVNHDFPEEQEPILVKKIVETIIERLDKIPTYILRGRQEWVDRWKEFLFDDNLTFEEFNSVWFDFYNWADSVLLWVNIHSPAKETV